MIKKNFVLSLLSFIIFSMIYAVILTCLVNPMTSENIFVDSSKSSITSKESSMLDFPYIISTEDKTSIFMTKWFIHHFITCFSILVYTFLYRSSLCGRLYKFGILLRFVLILLIGIFIIRYCTYANHDIHIGSEVLRSIYQELYNIMVVEPAFLWLSGVSLGIAQCLFRIHRRDKITSFNQIDKVENMYFWLKIILVFIIFASCMSIIIF